MSFALCRSCNTLAAAPDTLSSSPRDGDQARCPSCKKLNMIFHEELPDLEIAHVDCDAFYASVEKRDDPTLEDRPLIIGHAGGRGVVTTACYLARQSGARSAMAMFKALELCPDAVVMPPDMAKYKRVSSEIRALFGEITDTFEPVSLDEAYLDLGADHRRDPGAVPAVALAQLAQRVKAQVGVTVSIGLSYNKFLAKLASDLDKPDGFSVIGRGEAAAFLSRLGIDRIHGVGRATANRLQRAGIETVGDLQSRPEEELVALVGRFGRRLYSYARGEDDRLVTSSRKAKSISAETTFRQDTGSRDELASVAARLCERVARQLQAKKVAGGTVVLKLKTHDFKILTRNRRLAHPTQRADVLAEQARDLIAGEADGRLFRLIGVGVSDLRPEEEADPPDLFSI
jgi:DNA polymerase-4